MRANECIFFQLAKASQLGSRIWGQKVVDLNVTAVQAMVLRHLFDEDGVTSIHLGNRTELDSATMTGILDRIESAGFIEKKDNPNDRRSILIFLTEKGKVVGAEIAKRMDLANRDFLKMLNTQEKEELVRLIKKVRSQADR